MKFESLCQIIVPLGPAPAKEVIIIFTRGVRTFVTIKKTKHRATWKMGGSLNSQDLVVIIFMHGVSPYKI